jgi:hypothetical protein
MKRVLPAPVSVANSASRLSKKALSMPVEMYQATSRRHAAALRVNQLEPQRAGDEGGNLRTRPHPPHRAAAL